MSNQASGARDAPKEQHRNVDASKLSNVDQRSKRQHEQRQQHHGQQQQGGSDQPSGAQQSSVDPKQDLTTIGPIDIRPERVIDLKPGHDTHKGGRGGADSNL